MATRGMVAPPLSQGSLQINMFDTATPTLARFADLYPKATSKAMRKTIARFRRHLRDDIGTKYGAHPKKKMLKRSIVREMQSRKGFRGKYRHLHSVANPWVTSSTDNPYWSGKKVPPLRKAIRYVQVDQKGMAYRLGFTGTKHDSSFNPIGSSRSKSAMLYAKALQEGLFLDPKTKRLTTRFTEAMKRRMRIGGIPVSKNRNDRLNMRPRPVIDPFFRDNRSRMITMVRKEYELALNREIKKAEKYGQMNRQRYKVS